MSKFELPSISLDIEEKEMKAKDKLAKVNKKIPELEERIENDKRDLQIIRPEYEHACRIASVLSDKESKATGEKINKKIEELEKDIKKSTAKVEKLKQDQEKLSLEVKNLNSDGQKELFFSLKALLWEYRAASVEEEKDYSEEIGLIREALLHNDYTIGPRGDDRPNVKRILKSIDTGESFNKKSRFETPTIKKGILMPGSLKE